MNPGGDGTVEHTKLPYALISFHTETVLQSRALQNLLNFVVKVNFLSKRFPNSDVTIYDPTLCVVRILNKAIIYLVYYYD